MQKDTQPDFVSCSPEVPAEKVSLLAQEPQNPVWQEQITQLQTTLITLAPSAMLIRTLDSRVVAWNQGAQTLYGWSEQEARGQITHILLQTCFPQSREAVDLALNTHGYWEGKLVHTSRDGKHVIVDSRQVLVRNQASQPIAILEINLDVSEREQLLHEQAEARVRELALLQETTRQMEAFLGLVSHELKSPLTTIKATLQLAKRQLTRLKHQEAVNQEDTLNMIENLLNRAEHQTNVQNRLINDLIDVSRIQTNQLQLQMTVCDLVEIVQEVVEDQRIVTPHRTIRWDSSVLAAEVLADADRVGQVVNNYLSNALKYSPAEMPVDIRLTREETLVRVEVADRGPGLSEEQQQQIWKPFTRMEGINVKSGAGIGLGLGLYICRNLIEQQAGQVGIKSEQGCGSTFWFTLPLASTPS